MEGVENNLPQEEIIDEGRGLLVRYKKLFHGSYISGISKLNAAEETTIGEGVYLTSDRKPAEGYAVRRSRSRVNGEPVVYSGVVENLKFFDARNDLNVAYALKGFLNILLKEWQKEDLEWVTEAVLYNAIEKIKGDKINSGNLREIVFSNGKLFTEYIKSLGYDGIVAIEGGEGEDIGNHETYLVFDSEKVTDLSE